MRCSWSTERATGLKLETLDKNHQVFVKKNSKIVFDVISRFEMLRFREAMNRKFLDLQKALPNA